MRHAANATASPTEQQSNKSTTILLAIAGVMLVGLIYSVVVRDPDVSCPNELIGAWVTSAKGYEEGMLVITKTGVAFSVGKDHLDAQAVRRLEATPDGPRTLYTVVYGDSRRDEQTLSFYYVYKSRLHLTDSESSPGLGC